MFSRGRVGSTLPDFPIYENETNKQCFGQLQIFASEWLIAVKNADLTVIIM
jgi:hypothetical protein